MELISSERGIVMEKRGEEVVVLTPQGEWRILKLKGKLPQIGEEMMLPLPKKKKQSLFKVAAAALLQKILVPGPKKKTKASSKL